MYPEYRANVFVVLLVPQVVSRYGACREGNDRCRRDLEPAFAHCDDGVSRSFRQRERYSAAIGWLALVMEDGLRVRLSNILDLGKLLVRHNGSEMVMAQSVLDLFIHVDLVIVLA